MKLTLTILTTLLLAPLALHAADTDTSTVLFVSPAGNDRGPATEAAPLATIKEAQSRVRKLVPGMKGDIEVRLLPGVYFLAQPLAFTESDGGTGGFVVRYRCHGLPGEARIIYGQVLTGWKPWRDGIVSCQVGKKPFLSLYENDRRATLARHPNKEFDADYPCWDGPYYVSVDADVSADPKNRGEWIQYNAEEFDPASFPLGKMKLMIFPQGNRDWTKCMSPIGKMQSDNGKVIFTNRLPLGSTEENSVSNRFYYCDSLNLLDAPGEYFHDEASGVLYYKPFTGAKRARIIRPLGSELMSVKGGKEPARNIVFDGLRFEYGDLGSESAPGEDFRQMVKLENASGIAFSRCVFSLGRTGLMARKSRDIRVEFCLFRQMGVSGVVFNECAESRIADCRFEEVATTLLYGYGIYLKSCVNCVVEHSEICDSGRYALSLRGNVKVQKGTNPDNYHTDIGRAIGNRLRYLKIMHGGQDSGDMGVLHMAAVNLKGDPNINYVEQVTIANSWAHEGLTDPDRPWGLYVDWVDNSMHQVFRNVQLERVQNMETYKGKASSHRRSAFFNGAGNRLSAVLFNNSFTNVPVGSIENGQFDRSLMEYGRLGIRNIPPEFLRRACIAHWAFDEADGKVVRQSVPNRIFDGSRLDADWGGPEAVARVAGLTGGALRFGNAADTVATTQRVNAMLDFSILCWVRSPADSAGGSATIWSTSQRGKGSGLFCQHVVSAGGPGIAFEVEAGRTAVAPLAGKDNAWHLVAAVKASDTIRFYLDGREVAKSALTGPLQTGELRLGKHPLHPDGAFRGDLDEVRVYNYAVPPDMLRLLESSGRAGSAFQAFVLMNARSELALEEVADGVVRAVERRHPEDGQVWLRENTTDGRFLLRNLRSGRYLIGREDGQVTTAPEGGAGWKQIPGASPDGIESVRLQGGSFFLSIDNPVFGGTVSMLNQPAEASQEWLLLPARNYTNEPARDAIAPASAKKE